MKTTTKLTNLALAATLGLLTLAGCANPAAGTTPKTNNNTTTPTDGNLYITSDRVDATSLVPSKVSVWKDYGANVDLDGVNPTAPFEGSTCWKVTDTATGTPPWNGWGFEPTDATGTDLSAYYNGYLHFAIKLPAGSDVAVMVEAKPASQVWVRATVAGKFTADGAWHEVKIPVATFLSSATLAKGVTYLIAFLQAADKGATIVPGNTYYVDDVYLTKN